MDKFWETYIKGANTVLQQDRQYKYNVTLTCVCVTTVAVQMQ